MIRSHVLICGGTGCTSSGSATLLSALEEELKIRGLDDEIKVVKTGCFGLCELGPIMIVYPEGTFYSRVTPEVIPEIVEEHLLKGRPVTRLVYDETDVPLPEGQSVSLSDTNFYKKQIAGVVISLIMLAVLAFTCAKASPWGYICGGVGLVVGLLKYRAIVQYNSETVKRFKNTYKDEMDVAKFNKFVETHF